MSMAEIIPQDVRVRGFKTIAFAAALYLGLRLAGVHRLVADDAEGLGALLQIIGTLYSVVYAFAIYVIWGQFAAVRTKFSKSLERSRIWSYSASHCRMRRATRWCGRSEPTLAA